MSLEALLGPTVVGGDGKEIPTSSLSGKTAIGIYFSAHWCGPCRMFTPMLKKFYDTHHESKNFEIVFASSDRSESEYNDYYKEMPWKSLGFGNPKKEQLSSKFKVRGIPTFVLVDGEGNTITTDARSEIMGDPDAARFPYKPKTIAEILTDDVKISDGASGETTVGALRAANDYIGLYFSASWCGPCKKFTPTLSRWYKSNNEGKKFDIVFVSSDEDAGSMASYYGGMPWKALPFGLRDAKEELSKAIGVEGIPTLAFLKSSDMSVMSTDARSRVEAQPDEFPWPAKAVEPLSIVLGKINDGKIAVLFTDKLTDGDNEDKALAAIAPAAQQHFDARESGKADEGENIIFAVAGEDDDSVERVRGFIGLGDDEEGDEAVRFVITDIPSGVKYVWPGKGIPSADDVAMFVANVLGGGATPTGIRDKP
mmetsp:Transcript_1994/g.5542  ORF Transcript_1994/g.5542 Transcript_1994/m.5542 type:complete len:425 (-) Transcript_1994:168-1442(-)